MSQLSSDIKCIKANYDVVIVGSGYGGAVSALRMAENGHSVCLLERGKQYEPEDFPDTVFSSLNAMRFMGDMVKSGHDDSLIDFRWGQDIHVIVANGLGGGSLINAAVALRPKDEMFQRDCWPKEIREESSTSGLFDEAFNRSEAMLEISPTPDIADLKKYQALEKSGSALSTQAEALPMAISFEDRTNRFGVRLNKCQGCGDCWIGCKSGSKNSLDKNYLPAAISHEAEIFTGCEVDYIEKLADSRWKIHFRHIAVKRKRNRQSLTVTAHKVVLAAGALGSTEILLRSKEKGLKISDQLGSGFSGNGDFLAYGYGTDKKVNAIATGLKKRKKVEEAVGPSATGMIEVKNFGKDHHDFIVQDGTFLSILTGTTVSMNLMHGYFRHAATNLVKGAYAGHYANMQTYYVVSQDNAEGKMTLNSRDRLVIKWDNLADQPAYRDVDDMLEIAAKANGGTYFKNPLTDNLVVGRRPITVHPMGGCRMGENFETAVVNHKCQVFSGSDLDGDVYQSLYVCDGSVIPMSLGINPLLTITALAEYAMAYACEEMKQETALETA